MNNITVAIADYQETYRNVLARLLEDYGYKVILLLSTNTEKILEELAEINPLPDICILEMNIPGVDGIAVAKEIKNRWPSVKILACSLLKKEQIWEIMRPSAADLYVQKDTPPLLLHANLMYLYHSNRKLFNEDE